MLEFIPVLNALIILGSVILLGRSIGNHFKKEREYIQLREDQFIRMIKDVNGIALKIIKAEQRIVDHQDALERKMDALSLFVDKRNNDVTTQQNWFENFAKLDMLAARRNELIMAKRLKVTLDRVMSSAMVSRQPPASNDVLELEDLTKRIEELEEVLG